MPLTQMRFLVAVWPTDINMALGTDQGYLHHLLWQHGPWVSKLSGHSRTMDVYTNLRLQHSFGQPGLQCVRQYVFFSLQTAL